MSVSTTTSPAAVVTTPGVAGAQSLASVGLHAWFGKRHVLADINLEFPARLRVSPPAGVTVTKPDLTKDDAELTEAHLRFSVAFSPWAT